MTISVNYSLIETDKEGYLANLQDWTPTIAEEIAAQEGIELTEQHWEIIYSLRDFYKHYQISPAMRVLVKHVKQTLGDEKGNSIYLLKLFHNSPAKLASKIAGLPRPTNCL